MQVYINLIPRKSVRERVWKTLSVVVGVTTILNVSMVGALIAPKAANATNWPTDQQWKAPICNDDPVNDESPSWVDLKASGSEYGAAYYTDANNLYLRERVDADPVHGSPSDSGYWNEHAWVFIIQKDPGVSQYDYLVSLRGSGSGQNVELWKNTVKDGPINFNPLFNDPAEDQLQTWPTIDNARRVTIGSDYYVDWQIPLSSIPDVNLLTSGLYFATSADANNYNKDHLDCYNAPQLSLSKDFQVNHTGPWYKDARTVPFTANPGDVLTYRVTLTNAGGPATSPITVIDELGRGGTADGSANIDPSTQYSDWTSVNNLNSDGAGLSYTGSWGDGSADSQANDTLTATLPSMAGGGVSESFTFDATVSSNIPVGTSLLENTATSGTLVAETDINAVRAGQCVLTITKSVENVTNPGATTVANPAHIDDVLKYTIVVANDTTATANCTGGGVRIDDSIPTGSTYVAGSANPLSTNSSLPISFGYSGATYPGAVTNPTGTYPSSTNVQVLSWNAHTLAPGDSRTASFEAKVNYLAECTDINIVNTAKVMSVENPTGVTATATAHVDAPCAAKLTLVKTVVDGDKAVSNFPLYIDGNLVTSGVPKSLTPRISGTVYTATEYNDPSFGYTASVWGGACAENGTVTLKPGDDKVCTITNTRDTGSILVKKNVDTNGDGIVDQTNVTNWTWNIKDGEQNIATGSPRSLDTATYTISENQKTDYHVTDLTCDGVSYGAVTQKSVNVNKGHQTVCTFTNTRDTGTIELKKHWEGTAGATVLKIGTESGAQDVLMAEISGADGTTRQKEVPTGTYYNSETPITNYSTAPLFCFNDANDNGINDDNVSPVTVGDHDSVYVGTNQHIICSYTNTRNTGSITVNKKVNHGNGEFVSGNGDSPFRWGIDPVTGQVIDDDTTSRLMGSTATGLLTNTNYNVYEKTVPGYHPIGWFYTSDEETSCTSRELNPLPATVSTTGNQAITICNARDMGTLTLVKNVNNDNGGSATALAWTLSASGTTPISGPTGNVSITNATVVAGTYTLTESVGPSGYAPSLFSCVKNGGAPVSGNSITLIHGDNATCTITNDDIQPKLTVTKVVINDNGGTKVVTDFPLFVNTTSVTSGTQNGFNVGAYTISETTSAGYAATITGDCAANGTITLNPGDVKSCTITNNDTAPSLTVIKHVVNGTIGSKVAANFTMNVAGTTVSSTSFLGSEAGTTVTLNAGAYNVTEPATVGYASSLSADCTGTIAVGQTKTCTVTNTAIATNLTITKTNDVVGFTNPGKQVTYTVTVTNTATATDTAKNVVLTDTLPAGFTFVDTGLATKTTTVGDLAPAASKVFTFLVNIAAGQTAAVYTNTASAKGDNTATVTATSPVEVRVPAVLGVTIAPELTLTKTVNPTTAIAGGTAKYTVTINNPSDSDVTNIVLTDTLPKGFTFADTGKATRSWTIGTLKAHHQRVIDYVVNIASSVKAGQYDNKAVVISTELEPRTAIAKLTVKAPRVLGLATTGASMSDYLFFAFGTILLAFGAFWTSRLGRRTPDAVRAE